MRKSLNFLLFVALLVGCARVKIETEDPIKVDINMRIDIYQHVLKDVETIEDEVYGQKEKKFNNIFTFIHYAYAEDFSSDVTAAIVRRKKRKEILDYYFQQGYIGENKDGYLEILSENLSAKERNKIIRIITEENRDRELIYHAIAKKNGVDIEQVQRIFFQDHYQRAPQGYWFQVYDQEKGRYIWKRK